jgi:hypothetical protein
MKLMSPRFRIALVLVGAFAFGLLAAWAKGQNTDGLSTISQVRSDLGNLSTPWLLVAFIAGTQSNRSRSGALLGFLATMSALLGFYLLTSLIVDLGGHGIPDNLGRELWANRIYLVSGALSGPVFGALGAWWRKTRSLHASVVAGALLIGEPIVLAGLGVLFPATVVGRNAISVAVYASELALGLVVLVLARSRVSASLRQAR